MTQKEKTDRRWRQIYLQEFTESVGRHTTKSKQMLTENKPILKKLRELAGSSVGSLYDKAPGAQIKGLYTIYCHRAGVGLMMAVLGQL